LQQVTPVSPQIPAQRGEGGIITVILQYKISRQRSSADG
jgi:hypothetical protein